MVITWWLWQVQLIQPELEFLKSVSILGIVIAFNRGKQKIHLIKDKYTSQA